MSRLRRLFPSRWFLRDSARLNSQAAYCHQVAKLESALAAAKDALASARVDHVRTLKRLRKVEESFWWRITKPLRRLVKNHRWTFYHLRQ